MAGGAVVIWDSWQAFWSMGGRGGFVWGAYGVVALAVAIEALNLRAQMRRARERAAEAVRGKGG
jgi:heme exporter protein D